jgi:hypothetical protein
VSELWKVWKLWKLFFQRPVNIRLSEEEIGRKLPKRSFSRQRADYQLTKNELTPCSIASQETQGKLKALYSKAETCMVFLLISNRYH